MSRNLRSKSKRQYTKGLNNPAVVLVRDHKELRHGPLPGFIDPCLAQARSRPPGGRQWVHEIKFDGYRLQIHIDNGVVRCFTRRGYDWKARFPTLATAAWNLEVKSAIMDGEAVVINESGQSDFSALESYVSSKSEDRLRANLVFYAFDLLYLDAMDLRRLPLLLRKEALHELLLHKQSPLVYSEHLITSGADVYRETCAMELEGVVSKRVDAPYRSGRSDDWIKVTCRRRETFVLAGLAFKGKKFDGVYLARRQGRKLVYAGKVENGFSTAQVRHLQQRATGLTVPRQCIEADRAFPKAQWLRPILLGDVEYRAKTPGGLLRHPSYKGLREDLD
jgi:bifunctional non-homologous end joining protein LigD